MLTDFGWRVACLVGVALIVIMTGQAVVRGLSSDGGPPHKDCKMVKITASEYRRRCQGD